MSLKYFLAGATLVAALGFHVFANPILAAGGVRDAINAGDGDKLVAMIDFPALREDLKADLSNSMAQDDPMARAFGDALVSGMVDGFVKPGAVQQLVASNAKRQTAAAAESTQIEDYSLRFGLTRFTVTVQTDNGTATVVFAPRGLTWKIVGANLDLSRLTSGNY